MAVAGGLRARDPGEALASAVAALQGLDVDALADAEVEELVVAVGREAGKLGVVHARLAAAADARGIWRRDGSRSFAAWLARKLRCARSTAGALRRLGRSLRSMPAAEAAAAAGSISADHLREMAACQRFDPEAFAEAEATLVGHAERLAVDDFQRVCAAWREVVDPDGAEVDAARRHERRHLILNRLSDGTLRFLSGELDPVGAEAFLNELRRIEDELFRADWAEAEARLGEGNVTAADLARTAAQRRADALVAMANRSRTAPADGKRPRPLIVFYVGYETVTGRLCELASGVPVTPGQIVPHLTEADVERVVFGPGNRVIELSERARFFTGGLRRAIELRDRRCRFPGCDEPADRCEVDHRVPWSEGGSTTQENGELRCPTHNRLRNRGLDPPTDEQRAVERARRLRRERARPPGGDPAAPDAA